MFETYIRKSIFWLVGLTFITPLITFSSFYFPFIVPRTIFFRVIVEVIVFLYIVLILRNRKYVPPRTIFVLLLTAFLAALTLSSIVAGTWTFSFWSTYERMDGLVMLYHLYAFLIVIVSIIRSRAEWEQLLQMSVFTAGIVGLIGLGQLVGLNLLLASSGGQRVASTTGNATYLAAYLLIHLFFVIYFLSRTKEVRSFSFFKYGFLALDGILVLMHVWYGTRLHKVGILEMIFIQPFVNESNHFSLSLRVAVPLLLIGLQAIVIAEFWLKENINYKRFGTYIFYLLYAELFLLLIANTQTRGALVGLGFGLLFSVFAVQKKSMGRSWRIGLPALAALAVGCFFLILAFRSNDFIRQQPILSKIASISASDSTTKTRLETWNAAVKGFWERPILGWGVENFHIVFNKFFPTSIYTDEGTPLWFDRPHNLALQYLVEGGAVGLLLFVVFLGFAIIQLLRQKHDSTAGIIFAALLIAYVGQNLFVFDSVNSYIPFYIALGFIYFLTSRQAEATSGPDRARPLVAQSLQGIISFVAAVVIILCIYEINLVPGGANTLFVSTYQAQQKSIDEKSYDRVSTDKVLSILQHAPYLGRFEILGVYAEHLVDVLQHEKLPDYEIDYMVAGLTKQMEENLKYQKNDARYRMFLMNLYLNAAPLKKEYLHRVVEIGDETKKLSPTRPQIYYLTGRAHMQLGSSDVRDYATGIADLRKGVELAPWAYDAHWNLFAGYISLKASQPAADELTILRQLRVFDLEDYMRTLSVYRYGGDLPAIEKLTRDGIVAFPNSFELYVVLAQTMADQGNLKETRIAVAKAIELNPDIATDAQAFLAELEKTKPK